MQLLERAAAERAQLLQVQWSGGADGADGARALVLVFDLGRILVQVDASGQLSCESVTADSLPPDLVSAEEEEPWWRILGAPLTRVWADSCGAGDEPVASTRGVRLQMRAEGDNPRILSLDAVGGVVRIGLADAAAGGSA